MTERRPDPRPASSGWPDWLEQWVLPYLREPALWPVLVAIMGHVVVAVVALELALWRERSVGSGALLALLLAGSGAATTFEIRRSGRPGAVTATLALSWAASVGGAWLAERTGLL
jgi:hypothetical protein